MSKDLELEFDKALDYIYSLTALGWKPGLERFGELCARLGNPQDKIKSIHVGGTNGKGSTTAMISGILKSAGYRVGTYYSPYVYNIRERVQLDGGMITRSAFTRLINQIRPHAAAIGETELGHPTEFEVKTALGFLYFAEQGVDFAVLEVGLGGRLDATNVVNPLVSVITNVTMDHMDRLGNTIPEIAMEKAGIIKPDGHLVTAVADPDALTVMIDTCQERNSLLWHVRVTDKINRRYSIWPLMTNLPAHVQQTVVSGDGILAVDNLFTVDGIRSKYDGLAIRMHGDFQFTNAATSVGAIEALQCRGVSIPESAVREGLESAYIPGRLEVLSKNPALIIDGAHNQDGALKLAESLLNWFKYDKLILVMGMVSGHSIDNVVSILAPMADKFIATASQNARAESASQVAREARKYCHDVTEIESVEQAVKQALEYAGPADMVCVTGSFYVLNEVPRSDYL
ncbi:MAG: bifunctional folylpolyglutamate synthase/dihydrofolate synthase [Armatimonadota bacterium]